MEVMNIEEGGQQLTIRSGIRALSGRKFVGERLGVARSHGHTVGAPP
jgi:hypothetical protein